MIIDTNDWDFEDVQLRPVQSDDYLIILYNNWEYQMCKDGFEAFMGQMRLLVVQLSVKLDYYEGNFKTPLAEDPL